MPDTVSRSIIDALLPKGSLWDIAPDGDMDKLLDGIGDSWESLATAMECLSCIRDPFLTPILSDLEREYGIYPDPNIPEATRRAQLATIMFSNVVAGTKDSLQNALNTAGFDVQVHENSPAVDPDLFLNSIFLMVAGGDNAYAGFFPTTPGDYTSVAGKTGGELLVNGDIFEQAADYLSVANGDNMFAGNINAVAGRYDELIQTPVLYPIPDDPSSWPFFFFVGGDATRNVDGELTAIATADVPLSQEQVFKTIILKYKPLYTWAGLIINYT